MNNSEPHLSSNEKCTDPSLDVHTSRHHVSHEVHVLHGRDRPLFSATDGPASHNVLSSPTCSPDRPSLSSYYVIDKNSPYLRPHLRNTFVPCRLDRAAREQLTQRRDTVITDVLGSLLSRVFSKTTTNALLGRGQMHVLSTAQAASLFARAHEMRKRREGVSGSLSSNGIGISVEAREEDAYSRITPEGSLEYNSSDSYSPQSTTPLVDLMDRLLDIGAGDGNVTSHLQPLFREVHTTEANYAMQWRLAWHPGHYRVRTVEDLEAEFERPLTGTAGTRAPPAYYDVVSIMNVLDRCDTPRTLLRRVKRYLKPGTGRVLLAVVFPWCPFVEDGNRQREPIEHINMQGATCADFTSYEHAVATFEKEFLLPRVAVSGAGGVALPWTEPEDHVGYEIEAWTRVPYLSEGDTMEPYYALSDFVFVLRPL